MTQRAAKKSKQGRGTGIIIGLVVLVAIVGVIGVASRLLGIGPSTGNDYPACDTLPSYASVSDAYAKNTELTAKLKAVGPGVRVEATKLCGDQNKGAITIWYSSDEEAQGITRVMNSSTFGVLAVDRKS